MVCHVVGVAGDGPTSDSDARDGGSGSSDAGASASDGEGDEWMNVSSHQYVWPGWHVKVLACRSDMQHVHTCCEPCACLGMIGLCTIVSPMLIWLTFFLCGPLAVGLPGCCVCGPLEGVHHEWFDRTRRSYVLLMLCLTLGL